MTQYAPYDVLDDPSEFGLVQREIRTPRGILRLVLPERRKSSVATLFLHGVASSWSTWTPLLQAASNEGICIAEPVLVDLPGFGASENSKDDLNIEAVGGEIIEAIGGFGYESVRLVGHSMGGFLAMDMAATGRSEILSLHLISGTYFSIIRTVQRPVRSAIEHPTVSFLYQSQVVLSRLGRLGVRVVHGLGQLGLLRTALYPFVLRPFSLKDTVVHSLMTDFRPQSFLLAAANGKNYDPMEKWALIKCPISAVFGRHDKLVTLADMADLRELHPNANCSVIDEASHFSHVEQPHIVLNALSLG